MSACLRDSLDGGPCRIQSGLPELDRVLGGGLVPGSVILLGGEPGVGKSTLMLQASMDLALRVLVLHVAGEESPSQVAARAQRIGDAPPNLRVLPETRLEAILAELAALQPRVVVVDSIQTLWSQSQEGAPGTVGQIRDCAAALIGWAKESGAAVFLVGHLTKDGQLAGPRVLEHMVDTVLWFEGDRHHQHRLLRSAKNRFGASGEVGVFEMRSDGLCAVKDPSALFLEGRSSRPGTCATAILEGSRPLLAEVQALVGPSAWNQPQRVATGIDQRRLAILCALLDRHAGLSLAGQDLFATVAGGLRLDDPAADAALALSVAGSFRRQSVPAELLALGELGLGGELRPVARLESRLREAARLGFKTALVPRASPPHIALAGLRMIPCDDLPSLLETGLQG